MRRFGPRTRKRCLHSTGSYPQPHISNDHPRQSSPRSRSEASLSSRSMCPAENLCPASLLPTTPSCSTSSMHFTLLLLACNSFPLPSTNRSACISCSRNRNTLRVSASPSLRQSFALRGCRTRVAWFELREERVSVYILPEPIVRVRSLVGLSELGESGKVTGRGGGRDILCCGWEWFASGHDEGTSSTCTEHMGSLLLEIWGVVTRSRCTSA